MEEYPRYLIFGTLENQQFEQDGWECGWFSTPTFFQQIKRKLCKHDFTLWCTNQGIRDVTPMKIRDCKKCGEREEVIIKS